MNLYFECNMGAAGDMIASSLTDLFEDKNKIIDELNALNLPQTKIVYGEKKQNGINGVHLNIVIGGEEETPESTAGHHHSHGRGLDEVFAIVDGLNADGKVKDDIKSVYKIIAEAEARVHGETAGEIHFHELGTLDAIADIAITAHLINRLQPERITASPVNVGNGTVKCAHGELPVPAPATALILEGVPFYKSGINTELCTPTGAAILKYYTDEFAAEPQFNNVKKIGIGTGTKELEQANIIRAFWYEDDNTVTELTCNIDDITGEEAAFAAEKMRAEGALDCFITPIMMKKGRPAFLFTVLCKNSEAEKFARLIFRHTTTIGIRKYSPSRYTMSRELNDENGVTIKKSGGFGTEKEKIEFEDVKSLALREDISVFEARERLKNNK